MSSRERLGSPLLPVSDPGGWHKLHTQRDGRLPLAQSSAGLSNGQQSCSSMASLLWAAAAEQVTWSEYRTPSITFGHHTKECKWPICGQCHFTTGNTSRVCGRNLRWPFRGTAASLYGHRKRGRGTSAQGPFPPTAKLLAFQIPPT